MESLRYRVWRQLDAEARPGQQISLANRIVIVAILLSVLAVVVETEPEVRSLWPGFFVAVEYGFGAVFVAEYAARLWAMGERTEFSGPLGRLRYALTPIALFDLFAILPFLLLWSGLSVAGPYFYILRLMRLFRLLTLARTGPFTTAARLVWLCISDRRYELAFSTLIAIAMMVAAAALLFVAEKDAQPEAFGSIPRAMWWAIATLTTVGYGDVAPVTAMGKLLAGLVALSGVGLVAMPAGILASALSQAYQERRTHRPHEAVDHRPVEHRAAEHERHQGGMD